MKWTADKKKKRCEWNGMNFEYSKTKTAQFSLLFFCHKPPLSAYRKKARASDDCERIQLHAKENGKEIEKKRETYFP